MSVDHTSSDLQEKSTAELLKILSNQVTELVHQEMELAKVELTRKTKKVGVGAGMFGGAGAAALLAGGALVAAAIAGIATVLSVWLSALIIGAALLGVAGILALAGVTELAQGTPPIPEAALESTKEDMAWLKTQAKSAKP
jgi:uncharacterized membrane protein YqjE